MSTTNISQKKYFTKVNENTANLFVAKAPLITHLDIELTERCNNACIHCYINLPAKDIQAKERELSTDRWKDIILQAVDLGVLSIRFTGGEPLLREDFPELYLFCRNHGVRVKIFTNARNISPHLVALFDRIPPLESIEITSYGMNPDSYNKVACSANAFQEYSRGVNLLLQNNIPFVVKSVLLPPNRSEVEEFEKWVSQISGMEGSPSYAMYLSLRTRRDSNEKNDRIKSLRVSPEEGIAWISRQKENYIKGLVPFVSRFMYPQGDLLFSCGAGSSGCVDAYGKYQICMLLRHPDTIFDLKSGTLKEALTVFFPKIRQTRASNPDYLQRCARCFIKGLCEQCPAKSWSEHGTLDTPVEYYCQIAHAQARFLGLINDTENAWEVKYWKERINSFVEKTKSNSGKGR